MATAKANKAATKTPPVPEQTGKTSENLQTDPALAGGDPAFADAGGADQAQGDTGADAGGADQVQNDTGADEAPTGNDAAAGGADQAQGDTGTDAAPTGNDADDSASEPQATAQVKVKMKTVSAGPDPAKNWNLGAVRTVDNEEAESLVKANLAEII